MARDPGWTGREDDMALHVRAALAGLASAAAFGLVLLAEGVFEGAKRWC